MLAALSSGALAATALSSAGTANASCASFGGVVNLGKGCTTTNFGDTAIGIGKNVTVRASGGFNTAVGIGTNEVLADAEGRGNVSFALGDAPGATSKGLLNRAVAVGSPGFNPGPNFGNDPAGIYDTVAESDGTLNSSTSFGKGSIAFAVNGAPFGSQKVGLNRSIAVGNGNNAFAGFNDRSGRFAAAVGRDQTADDGINNGVK